jgi:hypothetical protein
MILLFIYLDEELVWTECCGTPQLVYRGSSHLQFYTFSFICYCCGIYVFVSLPAGCHAFVSPMLALLGARFCLVLWSICHEIEQLHLPIYRIRRKALLGSCTIGTSPLVDAVMDSSGVHANFSHHRVSPDLSAMASPTLVVDP